MTLRLEPEALSFAWQYRYWGAEREREIGTVMALRAQWNLVLRLLVDNGVRVNCVCLFGNVDLISQMHQVVFLV